MRLIKWILITNIAWGLLACGNPSGSVQEEISKGCQLDQKLFDKSEVFEPLASSLPENRLPRHFSLERYAPKRLSQGRQGSCTAWAAAYAATTILHAYAFGKNPNEIAYSPSYIYNQLTRGRCTGTHIGTTLDLMAQVGLVDFDEFPYTDQTCSSLPDGSIIQKAKNNRIKGYNRLTKSDNDYKVDIDAIKQNIAQGAPVITGIPVGGTFYQLRGKKLWKPTPSDYEALERTMDGHIVDDGGSDSFGGHALCIIGYDDLFEGGAFQFMNSWGEDWGDRGLFWMTYKDYEYFCNKYYGEAYGLYPIPQRVSPQYDFEASIGLLETER
ncbi:MAG: C1 family peptidase, partial [Flammeovirgaceae bacterium]|nr:C1 family peptidase [Flammeovirgaceae bacterium]MDW8286878.1 C1 family peptidase [Flammeovirgaceae bacterium]